MAPVASGTADAPAARTLGDLREAGCAPRALRSELQANLQQRVGDRTNLFPRIRGYDETVTPAVENALLCGHDIIFLDERGQAKTPMVRSFIALLDIARHKSRCGA